jgi:hypothetical protein
VSKAVRGTQQVLKMTFTFLFPSSEIARVPLPAAISLSWWGAGGGWTFSMTAVEIIQPEGSPG